jgi:hypothetical protein
MKLLFFFLFFLLVTGTVLAVLPSKCISQPTCLNLDVVNITEKELFFSFTLASPTAVTKIPGCVLLNKTSSEKTSLHQYSCLTNEANYKIVNEDGAKRVRFVANMTITDVAASQSMGELEFSIPDAALSQGMLLKKNFAQAWMKFSIGFGIIIVVLIGAIIIYLLILKRSKL